MHLVCTLLINEGRECLLLPVAPASLPGKYAKFEKCVKKPDGSTEMELQLFHESTCREVM